MEPDLSQPAPSPSPPPPHTPVELSDEQKEVLLAVQRGENVFFTGPAGTGKSVVLREIISWARGQYFKNQIAITSTTGIASRLIGGVTIHSWAGIRHGKEKVEILVRNISGNDTANKRWTKTKILIVDEVSMLDGNLFDKLEYIGRTIRADNRPFGGIQLVLTGDFFQLPPVPDNSYGISLDTTYVFQAGSWLSCVGKPIFLRQVFRQRDDTFIEILTAIRRGRTTEKHFEILRKLNRQVEYDDGIEATQLFPRKQESKDFNTNKLEQLPSGIVTYLSVDKPGVDPLGRPTLPKYVEDTLSKHPSEKELILKVVDAQVMVIQNTLRGRYVNGDIGKVSAFITIREALEQGIDIAGVDPENQRFQGDTDEVLIEVAKHLFLVGPDEDWRTTVCSNRYSVGEKWPLVEFPNNRRLLCPPQLFTVVGIHGTVEVSRRQVPLILAWAISIHKSQGQTLSRVRIDLSHSFECGQAYVALSRATSMETLEVHGFTPDVVRVKPLVLKWERAMMPVKRTSAILEEPEDLEAYFTEGNGLVQ